MIVARGHDERRERCGPPLERFPELRCEMLTRIEVGDRVVDGESVAGRTKAPRRLVYRLRGGVGGDERILR